MIDYRQSGVNIEEGYKAVDKYKESAKRTMIPGVLNGLGSFAGMFQIPEGMKNPVMVSGTDGVGTKLDIAFALKKYDTVGIDCVAMCVNDILCHGAKPAFFLDYIACGKLDSDVAASLVKGVSEGCLQSGCALLGGETAEMPGFYDEGKYDIAGFAVGLAEKDKIISGDKIAEGDVIIGIASSGVHSNGFSLVRKLVKDYGSELTLKSGEKKTIGEILLEPTRIYVKPVLGLMEKIEIHGMVHITGGGFYENVPRMFSSKGDLYPVIEKGTWEIPEIFDELVRLGASPERMYNTFNMGIGFMLAVSPSDCDGACKFLNEKGFKAGKIGYVASGREKAVQLGAFSGKDGEAPLLLK
ncbi:MAG: phosphoribosylformylglycinamidine cyclo-ligase [Spirochaetes bacterium]|uniref:Phosphoribosylformylglycinamidine cyclo-ligase n=1 Tax=Candidatus Gallitreponema excrementavium TaxID=2840840 RepID=A0A9D9HPA1_9SPIR|nr:phosphoribosylformylglycinamidine cyclo-ligase [Candidatus Gallitreponema excrementavium]